MSIFINPFFFIRQSLYKHIRFFAPALSGRLLDFGCGRKPYQTLFSVTDYIGVDMEQTGHNHANSVADVFYDGKHIPFPNHYFDSVFCSEVLEHIFNPDEILAELSRVTKPKGHILITVPFCWNEHEMPYDYARYSTFGITHLLQKHNFTILECRKSGNFARVMFQLWALYFFELFNKLGKTGYILSMVLIMPVNLLGSILLIVLPKNKSMYFNTVIMAEKNI
ncbi:MAG: class I SAM-dependent methyltransferase [Chitinophagaceae bacterium]|nr:class I SAM-dependent methyltransferase [Chitinophagaceae bacterium]